MKYKERAEKEFEQIRKDIDELVIKRDGALDEYITAKHLSCFICTFYTLREMNDTLDKISASLEIIADQRHVADRSQGH